VRPGLRFVDFVEEFEPAHNRPKNREADDPTLSDVAAASATCDSL